MCLHILLMSTLSPCSGQLADAGFPAAALEGVSGNHGDRIACRRRAFYYLC